MPTTLLTTGYTNALLNLPDDAWLLDVEEEVAPQLPGGWHAAQYGGEAVSHPLLLVKYGVTATASVRPVSSNEIHLCLPATTVRSARLGYLTYTLLERYRQRACIASVHAAAIALPSGAGVLILGDKGSGKTNTLLELLRQGCVPAGDDLIALHLTRDGVELLPSKRIAAVRGPSRPPALYYETKRTVALDGEFSFLQTPARVDWIFRVNVHSGSESNVLERSDKLTIGERLRLHENLVRYIGGLATPLILDSGAVYGPIPALDDEACASFRSALVESLGQTPFFYLQGKTAEDAAQLIRSTCGG